jgi:hypothetical protein
LTTTTVVEGSSDSGEKACISMPALIGSYVLTDPKLNSKLKDSEDQIAHIREFLDGKDRQPFFK